MSYTSTHQNIHRSRLYGRAVKTAIIVGLVGLAAPVYAFSGATEAVSVKVDIAEIESDRGVARIYEQLRSEAESACVANGVRPLSVKRIEASCTQDLLNDFVGDLNNTRLSDYHAIHRGEPQ